MRKKIGIVGAGPMAIYLLKHLLGSSAALEIVIYERLDVAGTGMPYRPEISPDYLLANIFSREIPQIVEPLADWLRNQPEGWLERWGVAPDAISARAFYPRTLIGAYLSDQLHALVRMGNDAGHLIEVRTNHNVVDIVPSSAEVAVVTNAQDPPTNEAFDYVVLATGHTWDTTPTEGGASMISPWPAANIEALPAASIGILGSSLSAVDVAVTLAHVHGHFSTSADGIAWLPNPGAETMHITMVSKTGILPEADFYYMYPYEPLRILTDDAVEKFVADGKGSILSRTFDLLMAELNHCDPGYLKDLAIPEPAIEAFGQAYFSRRQRLGAFRALRVGLAESRATGLIEETIAWRYALLRGHEVFEAALPYITDGEWDTFRTHLLPVFADCYAAVPHLSLKRLAALQEACVIDIVTSGEVAEFLTGPEGGVIVRIDGNEYPFQTMVDARGQSSALPSDLPFPLLVKALENGSSPVVAPFNLPLNEGKSKRVFCLSMPQILVRYPFSQGLPNCDTLSATVAKTILGTNALLAML